MYCLMKYAYFKTNNTNLSYCFHMDYINFRLNDCCTINHIYTELVKRALQCHKHITFRTHFFLCWFSNKIRPSLRFWSRNNFVGWFDYKGIKIQMRKRRWPRERERERWALKIPRSLWARNHTLPFDLFIHVVDSENPTNQAAFV